MADLDTAALEERLRTKLAELCPDGSVPTPELRAKVEAGLREVVEQELVAHGFDVKLVRALTGLVLGGTSDIAIRIEAKKKDVTP